MGRQQGCLFADATPAHPHEGFCLAQLQTGLQIRKGGMLVEQGQGALGGVERRLECKV